MSNSLTSLIFSERPERIAHDRSFPLSDMSDSLTVANLSWAIWANCSQSSFDLSKMSKWANEQWANERIPSPTIFHHEKGSLLLIFLFFLILPGSWKFKQHIFTENRVPKVGFLVTSELGKVFKTNLQYLIIDISLDDILQLAKN